MESESPGSNTPTIEDVGEGGGGVGGETVLVVEHKSLRSFTTNDEYLYAMKEDLADWFAFLYKVPMDAEGFFAALETGVLLCRHANEVQHFFKQRAQQQQASNNNSSNNTTTALAMRSYFIRHLPESEQLPILFRTDVSPGTFQARDNVSNFIGWCRHLGIPDVLRFETDDLVLRKNEKSVILCLLELARVGAKLGMPAPTLVRMEQEIEQELAELGEQEEAAGGGRNGEEEEEQEEGQEEEKEEEEKVVVVSPPTPPQPRPQIVTCDMKSLDELVRELVGHCTCPVQFPMIKVGEGKYQIGDSRSLIFVRVLRNHVMVRVGGGWDTLENYLNKHDPCRCHFKGHRGGSGAVNAARHQIIRRSSTSSIIATRIHPSSPSPHPPTTPTTPRKTPSMASMSSMSPAAAASSAAYPGAGGLRGSYSEHTSFIKGPSPSRGVLPVSHSFHKALSPARSSSPGPEGLLTPGRTSTSTTPTSTSHSSQGLVGILKNPPARSVSPEFEGVRRLPTSASSQSFRESRELAGGGSRESSVGRSLDSVRLSSSSSTTSTSRPSSPGFCSSSLRQGEDPRLRASQLPQYQRCKSPSPRRVLGVEETRCVSPAVSGGRSLLPRPVGCGGGSGSGIPRPVSPVSGSGVGAAAGRRPASSLSKSVSFDTPARTEVDPDSWTPTADTDVVVQSTTLDHRQGEGDEQVTPQLDQINTMTLSEFRKLINNHLSPQTSEVTEVSTARPVGSCQDEADGGPLKRSQSADPQTSSWHLVRDKARSMCSSFASRLSGKKPSSSGAGGPSPSILARRTPPKSPSGSRSSSSSTPAERPKTPSTVAGEQPKIPVLANRPKTPTSSSNAHRPKTPTANARSEGREPSRPQTPSRPKTPTAVNNHSKQPSSKAGSRNPLMRANSANAAYNVTTVVDSKAYASFTCTNSPSSPRKNIAGTSSDSTASDVCVKNSSYIHTSMQSADFGHTRVTGISLQTQFYLSSSDDECNDHGEGSGMVEEGEDKKQTAAVSVGGHGTPRSSRIPKPSFIPRATTPGPADAQPASTGKVNGSHVGPGGRPRISPLTGRSSLERELSADSGDGGREATTPQKRSQTPDLSSTKLNRVRRAHTPGPEYNSYSSSSVVKTPRSTTPGPEYNSYPSSPVVKTPRSTTPGPDSSSHKSKAKPNPVTLRGGSRKSAMDKKSIRRSRSLTDLIQAVEDISKDIQKNIPNKQQSSISTPRTTSTNSRPKLQRQKSCEADAEVLMISRNPQGQHSVYLPEQQRRGVFASPGPRKRLQPSASLDADKVRSRTPGPHMGLPQQKRGILRRPSQPAQNESDVHSMVFNRTDAWVDSTLHDPKRKHSTTHLRRPMTPNSLSIAESELLSRPLEEIQAALPSPSKVLPVADPDDLDIPPEDPEMYKKMEMLFEKYREMELRASVRHTPGGSQDNISGTTSRSPGSHLSSGGQGQEIQNSSTSSHSSSSVKPSVAVNPVSFSSGMSSVHSYDTDSSRAVSVEGRLSRDSSPSRTTSSPFHTHDSASNSGGISDPNVVLDDDESGASSVTPRPHDQPATPTPLDSLTDVDAETIARNPSALVSKIKEILQIRPRRDNKDKTNTRTRIPAPTSLTPRKHPEVLSPRATGPESRLSPTLHEPVPNGYDVSRDESSNSDFSNDVSSRPETPPVGKASKAGSLLSRARVRLFDKKQSVKNGGGLGSAPAAPESSSASPIVTPRQRWDEDDEEFV